MRRLLTARGLSLVAAVACALALVVGGLAYWTTSGSGSAGSLVSTLTAPSPTATSPTFGTAHVAWSTVTLSPAVPAVDVEVTFTVERKLSSGSTWTFVCGTGTTPKPYNVLSCDDTPPATDAYDYRVTAALRSWRSTGTASVSVVVDTVAPTSNITFPSASAVYSAVSWNSGCASTACGTASDTGGSGLQKVEVSLQRGSGNYWNGSSFSSASQVWNTATGTAAWSYGFAATSFPADGSYTVTSRATDNASNVQSPVTARTFTIDTTAPSITASAIAATSGTSPAGFVKQAGIYNVYADVSDANGVASVTANASAVTTGQTAVALTACVSGCTVGGHAYAYKSSALTASNPLTEGSKTYTVSASDIVGNTTAATSFAVVVDNTGPSVATVIAATTGTSPSGFVKQAGTYRVYANVTDLPSGVGASSGVNASTITANVTNVTTGQTAVALTSCGTCGPGSAYAYQSAVLTATTPLSEGNKTYSVSASDNLGTAGASSGANVQVDNTAPSVTTVIAATTGTSPSGFVKQAGTYRVYANVTDLPSGVGASSGVNASTITANVTNVTTGQTAVALTSCGTCGPGSAYAYQSAVLTATTPLSEGNKTYSVSASDNLGTAGASSGANVQVDNTAPSVTTVLASTTTGEPGWLAQGGGYRVYANISDLPAGVGTASGLNTSSITADVSSVTTGQTTVALTTTGCPCTIGGTSYAYQTAALTASNPLSAGSKSFTVNAADNLGSSTAQGGSVTIDNTAPALSTLQMFDTDADGKVDQVKATFGETLYTYSAGTTPPWTLANAPGGAGNTLASVSVATTVATLTLNEGTVNTASGSFTVALATNASGIRDAAGNLSSFAATAVADKAAPVPTNVVLANVTTAGQARSQDTLTVTYSETLDATSFCSTWTNGSTQTISGNNVVDVLIANSGSADILSIADVGSNCGGATNFKFGSVNLGANYVNANTTFTGTGANQGRLTWTPSANTLTITLGNGSGLSGVAASTPIYTPSVALDDLASPSNTMSATAFSAPATSRF